jgi:sigma-B regulation protein RsbU (phosphoserine phosphatase)
MGSSSFRAELKDPMSMSWMDWMGMGTAGSDLSSAAETIPEQAAAFDPEEANALYREVFEALQVPRRLSGPRRIRRGEFEIASEIFPAQFFSGDFVTVFDSGDATFLALGDIAGKGLTAAMWSTHILGLIRTYCASLGKPDTALQAINRDLYALASVPLTTIVLARLDWRKNQLTYSNAGHFAPLVHRADGEVEQLSTGGPVLAAVPDAEFDSSVIAFTADDRLVSYSDGLIECRNEEDEEFGLERLVNQVRETASLGASKSLFSIVGSVQDFVAGRPRHDDLSLMIVGR